MWVGVELQPRSQEVSQGSRGAFNQAMALACQVGARITIMHSTWHEGRTVPIGDAGKAALDAMVTEAIGAGLRTRLEVTDQRPWLALLRAALNESADLILVGKRDRLQAPSGRRLGSVATKLVRKCPAPVWVVKPGHDLEHKLILVATDLTGVGDQALRWSASLARWRGAALHIVHAWRHDSKGMTLRPGRKSFQTCGRKPGSRFWNAAGTWICPRRPQCIFRARVPPVPSRKPSDTWCRICWSWAVCPGLVARVFLWVRQLNA